MKKLIIILVFFVTSFLINGCYTVVWTPFVDTNNSNIQSQTVNNYYYTPAWDYYYNYPWWHGISLPTVSQDTYTTRETSTNNSTTRNDDGGRAGSGTRDIIFANPSRDQGSSSNNNNESTNNNNSNSKDSKNNNSGSTRNDDGSRSTSNPRR